MADSQRLEVLAILRAALVASAFLLVCWFQGSGINLVLFAIAWALPLLALSLMRPSRVLGGFVATPLATALAMACLVALAFNYQLSLSKDNSFAPTLGLALCPIGFLLGRALGRWLTLATSLVSVLVLALALRSAALFFLGDAQGALRPFLDANAYAALCYLVLIPWFHVYLTKWWGDAVPTRLVHIGCCLGAFVLLVTLFGAQSRGAVLVMLVAVAIWVGLALAHRRSLAPIALLLGTGVVAFVSVAYFGSMDLGGEFAPARVAEGVSVRGALVAASLDMVEIRPWLGVGVFVFPLLYRRHRLEGDQETVGLYAHNDYLQLLIEGGIALFVLAMVFAFVIGWQFLRAVRQSPQAPRFADIGPYMALGAALAHASITFIFYAPHLAFVIGLLAAVPLLRRPRVTVDVVASWVDPRYLVALLLGGLTFAWSCFAYLGVDAYTAGVLGGQRGLPGVARIRSDPRSVLHYAEFAQLVNADRGIPIVAQARLLEERLRLDPSSRYLQERTLDAHRRALEVDPWNPQAYVYMANLVQTYPQLNGDLREHENARWLITEALQVDPLFPPAIDTIVGSLIGADREEEAFEFLQLQVLPWLNRMSHENPEATVRYFKMLDAWAEKFDDDDVRAALNRLRAL